MTNGLNLTEGLHPFTFLVSEDSSGGYLSRDVAVIAPRQIIVPGQILSRFAVLAAVASTSAAKSDNTGNGTLTFASPSVDATAKGGNYKFVFTDATTSCRGSRRQSRRRGRRRHGVRARSGLHHPGRRDCVRRGRRVHDQPAMNELP